MSISGINGHPIDKALFREDQRPTQPWIWAIAITSAIICWGLAALIPVSGAADWMVAAALFLAGALGPGLLALMHMRTEVHSDGIFVRYRPFHLRFRRFAFDDIESAQAKRYSPVWDYGGWGIRIGFTGGWVYNVKGDMGVQVVMRTGKRIMFGTQRPDEFIAAIEQAIGNHKAYSTR